MIKFIRLCAISILLGVFGCSSPHDDYDASRMDLKPSVASISSQRHNGAFVSGSALSMDAAVKPLDSSPVKTIQIDTKHRLLKLRRG